MTTLRRWIRATVPLTALVLAAGLALAAGTGLALHRVEQHANERDLDRRTALARAAVAAEAQRYVDAVYSAAAAVGAQGALTPPEFAALTAPLARMRLPGAAGVAYVVPATRATMPAVQRLWRDRGDPGLTLKPHRGQREHAFVVLYRALDGRAVDMQGQDVTQRPEPAYALAEARRAGRVAVSEAYELIRDRDLPPEQRQQSFSLAAPVYGVAPAGATQGGFRGWLIMGLHGEEFVGQALADASQDRLRAALYAVGADGRSVQVAAQATGTTGSGLRREVAIQVAQQRWVLRTEAPQAGLSTGARYLDEVSSLGLVVLSLLLAGLVFVLGRGRSRAEARVAEATAALRAKQHYIGALVNTMDVIVVACDAAGRFTVVNEPARELHGLDVADGGEVRWPSNTMAHFFRTDGVTPMPPEELPLQRALREGEVHDVEFIVAPPGRPRRWLSAHGRLLRASDGTPLGVVTAAHDITSLRASESALRRAHAELAEANAGLERSNEELVAFAGLVSHDLKSPLASVAGYVDLLRELMEEAAAPGEVRPFLDRIGAGVQRMRSLIDDLLAFATARNAAPDLTRVDLKTVVDDVVAVNTDRARLRGGLDQLFPDIYVAALPPVAADPAMVRQLMENLVGNALKYVHPGRPARVDITTEPTEPGWVRVVVADRGVGIPAGQHAAIFESFHRAHRDYDYPGTGLGLAICHRIVERHGGRMGAAD
ncbi:MAG TPA: ATP-binding protein, partial [Pilimelia sp.]|nr:ATP-binding protein [Pilimelia sp.]